MTLTPSSSSATQTTWQIDATHSLVEFGVRHMMFTTVKGRFTGLSGTIVEVADDPAQSSVTVQIDAASITTGDAQRDDHLRGADFFDVQRYPSIGFTSTRVEGSGESFTLIGDLTIKGVTHEVALDVTFNGRGTNPFGKVVAGFSAETKINRKDFGLSWTVALESGGVLVGDSIKVQIELQAVQANSPRI
jgi:polyisoprenoid-binding protein YceI